MPVEPLRAGYTTEVKFWRDSDLLIPIRWYRACDSAPFIPHATVFGSYNYDDVPIVDNVPGPARGTMLQGEQLMSDRRWDNGVAIDLRLPTGKFCGTASQWAGDMLIARDEPVAADALGTPACCGALPALGPADAVRVTMGSGPSPDAPCRPLIRPYVLPPRPFVGFEWCAVVGRYNGSGVTAQVKVISLGPPTLVRFELAGPGFLFGLGARYDGSLPSWPPGIIQAFKVTGECAFPDHVFIEYGFDRLPWWRPIEVRSGFWLGTERCQWIVAEPEDC